MDIKNAKLVYSKKSNQFYKVMRIDEDVGIVYLYPTNNRHKNITKSQIAHMEDNLRYKYIVMHSENITAEQHFLNVMDSDVNIYIKQNEINNFKKNMLMESECAMKKLKELSETKSNEKIYMLASDKYFRLTNRKTIDENRKTYIGQVIPDEIIRLAWQKRLFIERSDDYCGKPKCISQNNEKKTIQGRYPCGFLIRNKGGIVIAGGCYQMSVQDVIDFVQQYIYVEDEVCRHLYFVPLSNMAKKQLKMCSRILDNNNLHYKNENNSYFWVIDRDKRIVAGSKSGFNLKGLVRFCKNLQRRQGAIKKESVTDST